MLDYLQEGFQLIDNDYKYMYVNNAVVKQSKYACKEDLIGFTMWEKYPGIDKTPFFKILCDCMNNKTQQVMENEFDFPNGSKGIFELKILGVPEGVIVLSTEVTDRKRAEIEKEEHIDELEAMMFLTSHQVRQPVSHIMGLTHLLDQKIVKHSELEKVTQFIRSSVADLDNFTRELTSAMHELKMKVKRRKQD